MAKKSIPAPTPAPKPERGDNRFVRATRAIIDGGENIDPAELALKAELDLRTAKRLKGVIVAIMDVLRDAKLMPAKATPKKAPAAPAAVSTEPEPAAA
jgi:hypothetical protein